MSGRAQVPELPKSLINAMLSRLYVRTNRMKGDGLGNRSTPPTPINSIGDSTVLHKNGGLERPLSLEDLSRMTGWTRQEIYSLTRRRRANRGLLPLPHKKRGRKLIFFWSAVLEWIKRQPGADLPEKGKA
jgi:hypothetical protein